MENGFKGTKGKWYSEYKSGYWKITDNEREGSIADVYWFNDSKNTAEHNAQLISKAPEMLEMLIECEQRLPIETRPQCDFVNKVKELIKEATTI